MIDLFAEPEVESSRHYRHHCSKCGRFVPFSTVRKLDPTPGEADEHIYQGVCRAHGRVEVNWGER